MNSILNMIFRILIRRGVSMGVNKSIDYMTRKKSKNPDTSDTMQNGQNARQTTQNAKHAMRTMQRFRKF